MCSLVLGPVWCGTLYFRVDSGSVLNPTLNDLTPRFAPDILSDEQNVLPSEP